MSKNAKAVDRLLAEGFFNRREDALAHIMSGAVSCGGIPVRTAGQLIPIAQPLSVKGMSERYVSKGGYKLEGALRDFSIELQGRVCLDAGACTGGFTDCLIKHGARQVYAVEVGYGQLMGSLAQHPAVVNLERTNLGDDKLLALDPPPTLSTADLSYLSLIKAVPLYRTIQHGTGELICLVKPLFETDDTEARRTGTLDDSTYEPLLRQLTNALNAQPDTAVIGVTHSPITGNHGTREFFLHVLFGKTPKPNLTDETAHAVARALTLNPYRR